MGGEEEHLWKRKHEQRHGDSFLGGDASAGLESRAAHTSSYGDKALKPPLSLAGDDKVSGLVHRADDLPPL